MSALKGFLHYHTNKTGQIEVHKQEIVISTGGVFRTNLV